MRYIITAWDVPGSSHQRKIFLRNMGSALKEVDLEALGVNTVPLVGILEASPKVREGIGAMGLVGVGIRGPLIGVPGTVVVGLPLCAGIVGLCVWSPQSWPFLNNARNMNIITSPVIRVSPLLLL